MTSFLPIFICCSGNMAFSLSCVKIMRCYCYYCAFLHAYFESVSGTFKYRPCSALETNNLKVYQALPNRSQTNRINVTWTEARKLSLQPNKSSQNNLNRSKKMIWNNQTDHVNVIWTKARKYLYNQTNQIKIIWTEARNDLNNQTDAINVIWTETRKVTFTTKQIKSK